MNTLIVIGIPDLKKCYLNISRDEAIARYIAEELKGDPFCPKQLAVNELTFKDSFEVTDIWAS